MSVWGTDDMMNFHNTGPKHEGPFKITKKTKITALCGAGISAESGVPTYRGSGGLWNNIRIQELATPQGFLADPDRGWEFYGERRKNMAKCQPNPGHIALAELEKQGYDVFTITQNIDGLQHRAGSSKEKVIEIHGSLWRIKCSNISCDMEVFDNSDVPIDPSILECKICGSPLRPAVVFFQEMLDPRLMAEAERRTKETDLFIVIGTSGTVYPAAGFAQIAAAFDARVVEMNLVETPLSHVCDETLIGPSGETLPKLLHELTDGEFKF